MTNPAYRQVELVVEWGDGIRTEAEADAIVAKLVAFAKRNGLASPYVEDYDAEQAGSTRTSYIEGDGRSGSGVDFFGRP